MKLSKERLEKSNKFRLLTYSMGLLACFQADVIIAGWNTAFLDFTLIGIGTVLLCLVFRKRLRARRRNISF